jgi:hypothetical protein
VTDRAPDYVEPMEGWRVWAVGLDAGRLRLRSLLFDAVWEPRRPLVAHCQHRRRSLWRPWRVLPTDHAAPEERCHCGIYAVREQAQATRYVALPLPAWAVCRAFGRVALWGEVVEGQTGWRAASAYPRELFVPVPNGARRGERPSGPRLEDVRNALAEYGVPVRFVDAPPRRPFVVTPAA